MLLLELQDSVCVIKRITELLLDTVYRSTSAAWGDRSRPLSDRVAGALRIDAIFIGKDLTLYYPVRWDFVVHTG